jgi:hypothetical protein
MIDNLQFSYLLSSCIMICTDIVIKARTSRLNPGIPDSTQRHCNRLQAQLLLNAQPGLISNKTGNVRIMLTLRRIHETIVTLLKQGVFQISVRGRVAECMRAFWLWCGCTCIGVCFGACSLTYPLCNAHVLICHLRLFWFQYFSTFSYKRHNLRKKIVNTKHVLIFSHSVYLEQFLL